MEPEAFFMGAVSGGLLTWFICLLFSRSRENYYRRLLRGMKERLDEYEGEEQGDWLSDPDWWKGKKSRREDDDPDLV